MASRIAVLVAISADTCRVLTAVAGVSPRLAEVQPTCRVVVALLVTFILMSSAAATPPR